MSFKVQFSQSNIQLDANFASSCMLLDTEISVPSNPGGGGFATDETLAWKNGKLGVNTTDVAAEYDQRPITSQGVYNEFAVINALLKTI